MAYKTLAQLETITNNSPLMDDLGSAIVYGIIQEEGKAGWDSYGISMSSIATFVSDYFNLPLVQMQSGLDKAKQLEDEFNELKNGWNLDVSNTLSKVKDIEKLADIKEIVEQIYSDIMTFAGDTEAGKSVLSRLTTLESQVKENSDAIHTILNPDEEEPAMADDEYDETADIDAPSGMISLGTTNLTEAMYKVIQSLYSDAHYDPSCIKFDTTKTAASSVDENGMLKDLYTGDNIQNWWNGKHTCFDAPGYGSTSDLNTADNAVIGLNNAIHIYGGHLLYETVQSYEAQAEGDTSPRKVTQTKIKYCIGGEVQKNCIANFYLSKNCPIRFFKDTKPLYCHLNINGNAVFSLRKDSYSYHSTHAKSQIADINYLFPDFYNAYSGYLSAGTKFTIQSTVGINVPGQVEVAPSNLSGEILTAGFTVGNSKRLSDPFGYITTEVLDLPIVYRYNVIYHFSDCNGNYFDDNPTIEWEYDTDGSGREYKVGPKGEELYNLSAYTYVETKEYKAASNVFQIKRPSNSTLVLRLNQILVYGENHSRWNDLNNENWYDLRQAGRINENDEDPEDESGAFIKLYFKKMKNYVFDAPSYDQIKKNLLYSVIDDDTIDVTLDKIVGGVVHIYMKYKRSDN